MVVFNNPGYYHALDNTFTPEEHGPRVPIEMDDGTEWETTLGPKELGMSANPMQNQIQALGAKIREGVNRVELEFPGAGKGSSQSPTPESYGSKERRELRELTRAADIETSTHATFGRQGFSGLTQEGFNDEARYQNVKEVKKAIEFAAEATTGGAVVFHTGEWQRPISEIWGKKKSKDEPVNAEFRSYEEEGEKAAHYLVDERTGRFVSAISKDRELFRPVFQTAKDLAPDRVGKYDPEKGAILEAEDYIDIAGKYIDETNTERLFERVPKWNEEKTNFHIQKFQWKDVEAETEKWNKKHPEKFLTPQEMYIRIEVENQVLQAKGSSLYHAQRYNEHKYEEGKIREALNFYKELDKSLPESEKWKLMTQRGLRYTPAGGYTTNDSESIPDMLERELKSTRDSMRYVHEASASADAQAKERQEMLSRIRTVENYGLKKSAKSISEAGMFAYDQTKKNEKELKNPIYIAPENWQTTQYGSHPDELVNLVKTSRQQMAQQLMEMRGKSEQEAKKLASQHIKSTIDIGHMNLWRQHFVAKKGESDEARNKRFNQWAIAKTKKMIDEGIVGHIHIADNLGWDDEHLTPGEGNAPIKEFLREMEKAGIKDFIVEPGSFNPHRVMGDTLTYLGSPIYAAGTPQVRPMGHFRETHFGYSAPSNYIVGAYSPSNEWKLWSEVQLE